jgi:hypothetical protein
MGRIRVDMNPGSRYTTDPGVYTTNLAAWYRADAITGKVDADTLAVWPDSSGNNRDAVMSVVANRPLLKTAIINGKPVVRFASSDYMATAAFASALTFPLTLFVVGKTTATTPSTFAVAVDGIAAGSRCSFATDNTPTNWLMSTSAAGADTGVAYDNTTNHVFACVYNGASSFFWKDGGAKATINTGAGADLTGLTLGAYVDGSLNWLGDLAEVMLLDEATSIANVNVNGQALANKYGLTWTTAT